MKILITLLTLIMYLHAQNVGESIYNNIIIKDIKEANQNLDQLTVLVDNNASDKELKNGFTKL
ncbi:MAG: hypothetical protein DRQ78_13510, partial [Epsilonproteobacteria bacterium]